MNDFDFSHIVPRTSRTYRLTYPTTSFGMTAPCSFPVYLVYACVQEVALTQHVQHPEGLVRWEGGRAKDHRGWCVAFRAFSLPFL